MFKFFLFNFASLISSFAMSARGAVTTFRYEGVVDKVERYTGGLLGPVSVHDTISGYFTFDPDKWLYGDAYAAVIAISIGSSVIEIDSNLNFIRAQNNIGGVNFVPSAEMWLGPHFWQYAKCTKEDALAADFFLEKRDTPHFLYLRSWPHPFSRPDGEQGRQQQRIWKLFFNEDCEWPPGSGNICDEPMYGPPGLMP